VFESERIVRPATSTYVPFDRILFAICSSACDGSPPASRAMARGATTMYIGPVRSLAIRFSSSSTSPLDSVGSAPGST
jgi:hypothetical protein